jgi:hypothetical protein
MSPNLEYKLPDIVAEWPWPRCLSPYYLQSKEESDAWIESFRSFEPPEQEKFERCDFSMLEILCIGGLIYLLHLSGLLASLAYSWASKGDSHVRISSASL